MATIKYTIKSNSNPTPIYCRYVNTRSVDITTSTNILINPDHWDNSKGKARHVLEFSNAGKLNKQLTLLEHHIYDSYNMDYMDGKIIDKAWLDNVIRSYFNRPKGEEKIKNENHTIYYTDFARWWLKEKSGTWLVSQDKYMPVREVNKYTFFIELVNQYQEKNKLKLMDISSTHISDFVKHLLDSGYSVSTIKRHIGRFKFFLNRAEEMQLKVNPSFKQRVFTPKKEDVKKPYLNEYEIEKIFKYDFSDNDVLDSVRDSFVIGCWSGLRISDFNNNLKIDNIKDGYIEIKTTKTGVWVTVPLHDQVKSILDKRYGNLPQKISDQKFNKHIKTICCLCDIDEDMVGDVFDKNTKRNKRGIYPKHKLITSHTARRSFCTNLFGKVPNSVIQKAGGWSDESMMLHYMKKTNRENASEIEKYWNSKKI